MTDTIKIFETNYRFLFHRSLFPMLCNILFRKKKFQELNRLIMNREKRKEFSRIFFILTKKKGKIDLLENTFGDNETNIRK